MEARDGDYMKFGAWISKIQDQTTRFVASMEDSAMVEEEEKKWCSWVCSWGLEREMRENAWR